MWTFWKNTRFEHWINNYPFGIFERTNNRGMFESPLSEKVQTVFTGTKHNVTTSENKIFYRELIRNQKKTFEQERTKRGTGLREPEGRFARNENKGPITPEKYQSHDELLDTCPESLAPKTSASPEKKPGRSNNLQHCEKCGKQTRSDLSDLAPASKESEEDQESRHNTRRTCQWRLVMMVTVYRWNHHQDLDGRPITKPKWTATDPHWTILLPSQREIEEQHQSNQRLLINNSVAFFRLTNSYSVCIRKLDIIIVNF